MNDDVEDLQLINDILDEHNIDSVSDETAVCKTAFRVEMLRQMWTHVTGERDAAQLALRNVLALSHRIRKTDPESADHLRRFCASAGVLPAVAR